MTPYLMRLIRRARGDSFALRPARQPDAGDFGDFSEPEDRSAPAIQRPGVEPEHSSPPVLQTENSSISRGRKRDLPAFEIEDHLKEIRRAENPVVHAEPHADRTVPRLKGEILSDPARNMSADLHSPVNNSDHGDPAGPDSAEPAELPPGMVQGSRLKNSHQTRNEINVQNVEVPDKARPPAKVEVAQATQTPPVLQIDYEAGPSVSPRFHPRAKQADKPESRPVVPLHPRRRPEPRQGSTQPRGDEVTVEIGSVVIETTNTPSAPKQPAVLPRNQRRKRPGITGSKNRGNRRPQRPASRLTYGLGAL